MFLAGKYYVGDLCYVDKLSARWDRVYEQMFPRKLGGCTDQPGLHEIDGMKYWYHRTAYGDGCYEDLYSGLTFPVDAGIIGVCSAEDALEAGFYGGHIVEFADDFEPYYEDGVFHIGHLTIDTICSENEDN